MVRATGELDVDDTGRWDYHGASSGINFLRRMGEEFGSISKPESSANKKLKTSMPRNLPEAVISAPTSLRETPSEASLADELPPKTVARELCSHALDDACVIMFCVHQPSFYEGLDRIYELPLDKYENQDHRFLPLVYTVMALGCLFASDEQSDLDRKGYESATDEGYVDSSFQSSGSRID